MGNSIKFFLIALLIPYEIFAVIKSKPAAGYLLLRPKVGLVRDSGSLSDNKPRPYFGIELSLFRKFRNVDPFLSLELSRLNGRAKHENPFPFEDQESLTINSMNYQAGICFLGDKVIRACPVIGQSILDINGSANSQAYGAVLYGLKMEYSFLRKLVATTEVINQLVFQKHQGRSSWGRFVTINFGIGVIFR